MKKVTIFTLAFIVFLGGALYSCNGFEDLNMEQQPVELTEEAQQLKELYQTEMLKMSEMMESRTASEMTEEEALRMLSTFTEPTIKMLNSYGLTEKEWEKFGDIKKPTFVLAGMLFLAVVDSNNTEKSFSYLKSRATEDENDETCYSEFQAFECLKDATGIDDFGDLIAKGCLTRTILLWACESVVGLGVGAVTVAYVTWKFSRCMGWI